MIIGDRITVSILQNVHPTTLVPKEQFGMYLVLVPKEQFVLYMGAVRMLSHNFHPCMVQHFPNGPNVLDLMRYFLEQLAKSYVGTPDTENPGPSSCSQIVFGIFSRVEYWGVLPHVIRSSGYSAFVSSYASE